MSYAVYTRSHPTDSKNEGDRQQYLRCQRFGLHFGLGKDFPHYSDTLQVSAEGAVNGMQNLLDDIRLRQIDGVIVLDARFLSENASRLVQIVDYFASHQIHLLVVKETIPCPKTNLIRSIAKGGRH